MTAPAGVHACARLAVVDGRTTWTSAPPLVLRRTSRARVHLVAVGGGPLGGDDLRLDVDVGPGQTVSLHSAAATVVQPGPDPTSSAGLTVTVRLGAGASLDWCPEPTVVTDRADWTVRTSVTMAAGARLTLREQVVLGRSGQRGGRCRSEVRVEHDGRPLLATATVLDGADPGLAGPGGTGGARSVGTLVVAGTAEPPAGAGVEDDVTWAWTPLDGPGAQLVAVGSVRGVRSALVSAFGGRGVRRHSRAEGPPDHAGQAGAAPGVQVGGVVGGGGDGDAGR